MHNWHVRHDNSYPQLRARRLLVLFKDVPLRTRRALSLYKVYGDIALLVLNGTALNNINALLVLSRRYTGLINLWLDCSCTKIVSLMVCDNGTMIQNQCNLSSPISHESFTLIFPSVNPFISMIDLLVLEIKGQTTDNLYTSTNACVSSELDGH